MSTTNEGEETKTPEETPPKKKAREPRIQIGELLAHGDPATRDQPKTWKEVLGFPLVLAIVFFVSLLTFHYAPHEKSLHKGFNLPKGPRPNFDALKKYREEKAARMGEEAKVEFEEPPPPPTPQQQQVDEEEKEEEIPVPTEDIEPQENIPQENLEETGSIPVPGEEEAEETEEDVVATEETEEKVAEVEASDEEVAEAEETDETVEETTEEVEGEESEEPQTEEATTNSDEL